MASDPAVRGQGYGKAVLEGCLTHLRTQSKGSPALLWCNARTGAVAFYQGLGFAIEGEEFDIPDVGPHFMMSREDAISAKPVV